MNFEDYLRTYPTSVLIGNMMTVGEVLALYERIAKLEAMLQVTPKDKKQYSAHLERQSHVEPQDIATAVNVASGQADLSLNDMTQEEQAKWYKGVQPIEL